MSARTATAYADMPDTPMVDLSQDPRNIIRRSREVIDQALAENAQLKARVRDLESALAKMITQYEDTVSNTDGHYPSADHGCIECTLGTVPDHLNTGLCGYHRGKELLK